jgi:hypothetical protein
VRAVLFPSSDKVNPGQHRAELSKERLCHPGERPALAIRFSISIVAICKFRPSLMTSEGATFIHDHHPPVPSLTAFLRAWIRIWADPSRTEPTVTTRTKLSATIAIRSPSGQSGPMSGQLARKTGGFADVTTAMTDPRAYQHRSGGSSAAVCSGLPRMLSRWPIHTSFGVHCAVSAMDSASDPIREHRIEFETHSVHAAISATSHPRLPDHNYEGESILNHPLISPRCLGDGG